MAYQVLARKYRPKSFGDVVGQRGVTQTLRNAIATDRLAQAFVFAGPRGVGKTTTARILARALNCEKGPTPDPCGACESCKEIAEGRDIDVLEIDGATHTKVETVREVIIAGLSMAPVRDRFKVFIIDECHQLSTSSFNALLKSIEEPPAHVIFMMATTELRKIPETILSRSQVYQLRMITTPVIADALRKISTLEEIAIDDVAIDLVARAGNGSMRDAQSALDQVVAFTGDKVGVEEVSTVLGLIGRETVLDVVEVVANEDPANVFKLSGRFVEAGYDLRLVCRELTRVIRDLLVLSIDATRADDQEITGDAERSRLISLVQRFSREDLMRAFDVFAAAELAIRTAAQPRYHFEMAVLKWMHLKKLIPLTTLLAGDSVSTRTAKTGRGGGSVKALKPSRSTAGLGDKATTSLKGTTVSSDSVKQVKKSKPSASVSELHGPEAGTAEILVELKRAKKFFYGTVVAQAQRVDLEGDKLIFGFTPGQRTLASQVTQNRAWLEQIASTVVGRKIMVSTEQGESRVDTEFVEVAADGLRQQVMNDPLVQSVLEVFPAEIADVEKLK